MFLWVQRVSNGQLRLLFSITIREFALTSFIYSKMALQGDRSFWTLWSCSYMILDSGKLMRQLRSALQRGSGCFAQYSISDGTFLILGGPVSVRRCPYTLRRWDAKASFGSQFYKLLKTIYLCLIVNGRTAQCHSNFAKKRPNFAVSY